MRSTNFDTTIDNPKLSAISGQEQSANLVPEVQTPISYQERVRVFLSRCPNDPAANALEREFWTLLGAMAQMCLGRPAEEDPAASCWVLKHRAKSASSSIPQRAERLASLARLAGETLAHVKSERSEEHAEGLLPVLLASFVVRHLGAAPTEPSANERAATESLLDLAKSKLAAPDTNPSRHREPLSK